MWECGLYALSYFICNLLQSTFFCISALVVKFKTFFVFHLVFIFPCRVNKEMMEPHAQQTLSNLFGAMSNKGSEENEYIMKSIMRTMSLLEEKMVPFVEIVVTSLTEKLLLVAKVISVFFVIR